MDHDQRFKVIVREFHSEFAALFVPHLVDRADLAALHWLDKEVFLDPPQGRRRVLDLVGEAPLRETAAARRPGDKEAVTILVHYEIESEDTVEPLRCTMFTAYEQLRRRHGIPVFPIGIYLRVGLDGLGRDAFREKLWEDEVVEFRFWYVGLPALDADRYLAGDNWLGVALSALMRIAPERKAWLKAEALRRLVGCPESDYRRYLLCECVQAYLPLEGPQLAEFEHLLVSEPYREVKNMQLTWKEEGRLEGEVEGQRKMLRLQLETRFGTLAPEADRRLREWPPESLTDLGRALVRAHTLKDLGLED